MPDPFLVIASGFPNSSVPRADAKDSMMGAVIIPSEVTDARRRGQNVKFVQQGPSTPNWYWEMPDGTKIYHK